MTQQQILHVDLDAFFASVEERDHPKWRGKPILVGGDQGRGVVAAASYEARKYGVHSAMPMATAKLLCPQAIVAPPRMKQYTIASREFFSILGAFSPLVENLSIDEAFLDLSGISRLLGSAEHIGDQIKTRVRTELGLIASVGIGPTKFVAKIASDIRKPDGLLVVEDHDVLSFLHPLPISRLWGVGQKTQRTLKQCGLHTIGDIAAYPRSVLEKKLGTALGRHLSKLSHGGDPRRVENARQASSIGHEQTFDSDIFDIEKISNILLTQSDKIARRLRQRMLRTHTVVLKIKFANFRQITRRCSLDTPCRDSEEIAKVAQSLLSNITINAANQVRLCGISVCNLEATDRPRQLCFHDQERQKREQLGETIDSILDRFGDATLLRASQIKARDRG